MNTQIKRISVNYATTHYIKFALIAKNLKPKIGQYIDIRINSEIIRYLITGINTVEINAVSKKFFFVFEQKDLFGQTKKVAKNADPKTLDFGIFSDDFFKEIEKVKGSYFAGYCLKLEPWT